MHLSTTVLALLAAAATTVSAAEAQIPLKDRAAGWFEQAKAYVSSAVPASVPSAEDVVPEVLKHPLDAGAAAVAARTVERINIRNWQRKLAPKPDSEEEWMVFLTGGNKTCYGKCGHVNLAWNESVPLLAALPQKAGSPRLKLGLLDCEKDEVLCTAWASGAPVIYHFLIPRAVAEGAEKPKTPVHIVPLNLTTTEASDIVAIPSASESKYLAYPEYEGLMHPIDGMLAQFGLIQPFGYFMWGLGSMPGWVMMLGISFVSRQIMSRRMARSGGIPAAGAPAAAPQERVAPVSSGSQPKSGGSAKKRK